ncbi:MAG: ATP-binding protein [Thermodesulfobacteriota bacterium]
MRFSPRIDSNSIRTKLIFLGVLLAVLNSSIVGLTLVNTTSQTMVKGEETIAIAFAVNTAEECTESLRATDFSKLKERLNSVRRIRHFGEEHIRNFIVIDDKGNILAQNNAEKPDHRHRNYIIKKAITIEEPQVFLVNKDKITVVAPIKKDTSRLGSFIMDYDLGHIAGTMNHMWKTLLSILIVLTGVGVIGSYGLSSTIIAPIQKLVDATGKISEGDLTHRLNPTSQDELGKLAACFNKMVGDLQKTTVSRDYVDNIIESMIDSLIVTDPQGKIERVNQAALDLLGYKEIELRTKTVDMLITDDPLSPGGLSKRLARDGAVKNYETIYHTKTGQAIPIILAGSVMHDAESNMIGMVIVAKNITERKKAEEELRRYQGRLEEMVKERTVELTITNEKLQQEIMERKQIEEELRRYQGQLEESAVSLQRINEKLGQEIDERKQVEEMLIKSARELEEMNEQLRQNQAQLVQTEKMASIGQLAAGVAHEINNPVGFINSNLTTLDEYRKDLTALIQSYIKLEELAAKNRALATDPELVTALEVTSDLKDKIDLNFILDDLDKIVNESKEGTDRVKRIVQDLKNFSHVDQSELIWTDLNKGMESTLNIVWNELKYKATVTKDYGDIPEVCCYPQQVNQVFMNILVNAAHAIEERGEIKISTVCLNGDESRVEVRISDTGKGIPPENLKKIFNPFFTTKPIGKGTGLGLSMAYSIVKKHDGEIKVESEVGKGTTFIITLPVNGPKGSEATEGDTDYAR